MEEDLFSRISDLILFTSEEYMARENEKNPNGWGKG